MQISNSFTPKMTYVKNIFILEETPSIFAVVCIGMQVVSAMQREVRLRDR